MDNSLKWRIESLGLLLEDVVRVVAELILQELPQIEIHNVDLRLVVSAPLLAHNLSHYERKMSENCSIGCLLEIGRDFADKCISLWTTIIDKGDR